jgi:hypothetical protein
VPAYAEQIPTGAWRLVSPMLDQALLSLNTADPPKLKLTL